MHGNRLYFPMSLRKARFRAKAVTRGGGGRPIRLWLSRLCGWTQGSGLGHGFGRRLAELRSGSTGGCRAGSCTELVSRLTVGGDLGRQKGGTVIAADGWSLGKNAPAASAVRA